MSGHPYVDEQVLKYREKYRMVACTYDLENERIYIEGKRTHFIRQELGNCFSMLMPEQFEAIPKQMIQEMFPAGDSPQVVRASADLAEMLTFNTLSQTPSDAAQETATLRIELNKLFVQDVFYTKGMEQTDETQIHWFDFKHFAMDGEEYVLMFAFALDDTRGFLGSFRCGFAAYDSWKPCVLAMLKSISFVKHTKEEMDNA